MERRDGEVGMIIANIYVSKPTYYNRWGEKIQDWDNYGKKTADKVIHSNQLVDVIFASDEIEARRRADYLYDNYTIELSEV